jgi:hypothetical protein
MVARLVWYCRRCMCRNAALLKRCRYCGAEADE